MDHRIIVQIESGGSGEINEPISLSETTPSPAPKATAPAKEKAVNTISPKAVLAAVQNPVSFARTSALSAAPVAGSIIAAAAVAVKVITVSADISALYTGDTYGQTTMSNFRAGLSLMSNPIGSGLSYWKQSIEIANNNRRAEQERALLGEASTNSTISRGY